MPCGIQSTGAEGLAPAQWAWPHWQTTSTESFKASQWGLQNFSFSGGMQLQAGLPHFLTSLIDSPPSTFPATQRGMPSPCVMHFDASVTVRTVEKNASPIGVMDLIFFCLEHFSIHIVPLAGSCSVVVPWGKAPLLHDFRSELNRRGCIRPEMELIRLMHRPLHRCLVCTRERG